MRQVGSLPDQREAERFAAYLVTQGIDAHAEQDTHDWAVWVRDEDRLDQARQSPESLQRSTRTTVGIAGVERDAEVIRREELQRRAVGAEEPGRNARPLATTHDPPHSPHDDHDRAVDPGHGLR